MADPKPLPEDTAWIEWAAGDHAGSPFVQERAFRAGYQACEEDSVPQSYYDNAVAVGNAEKRRADEAEAKVEAFESVGFMSRTRLIQLMDEVFPVVEPVIERNPNRYGDDRAVDIREDERETIERFIDAIEESQHD
jgi:hypothetical protein